MLYVSRNPYRDPLKTEILKTLYLHPNHTFLQFLSRNYLFDHRDVLNYSELLQWKLFFILESVMW